MLSGKKLGVIPITNMEEPEETNLGVVYQRFNQKRKSTQSVFAAQNLFPAQNSLPVGVDPKLIFTREKQRFEEQAEAEQDSPINSDEEFPSDHNYGGSTNDDGIKLIGTKSDISTTTTDTETINMSNIMRETRKLTDEMVVDRILNATNDFEKDVLRFATLVAGKWCATSKSELESFYQKPTEEREAERSGRIRDIIEKLALKPVSETWQDTKLENIEELLRGPSVGSRSFMGAQYNGVTAKHHLVLKIGAPQQKENANEDQFARADQQLRSISSTNSEIIKKIRNYFKVLRDEMKKLDLDRGPRGRSERLFSQSDPSHRSDRLSYETSYDIPKRESKKDALSREGKKLALEKFKTSNLTPSDMYLLRTFYPSLFPENNTRVATIWMLPDVLEVVLSSITARLQTALEETALYINLITNLQLEPYHLLLCKNLQCTHLFVDICATSIKSNFNFTRASNVTTQNAQDIEKKFCEFSTKCRFINFNPVTLSFSYDLEGYKLSLRNSALNYAKRTHARCGIHPVVIAKKFGPR